MVVPPTNRKVELVSQYETLRKKAGDNPPAYILAMFQDALARISLDDWNGAADMIWAIGVHLSGGKDSRRKKEWKDEWKKIEEERIETGMQNALETLEQRRQRRTERDD